jgi:nucleoside-diphosphate-sugar epimerase
MFRTETELDDLLSEPPPSLVDSLARIDGDLLLLGVSGKMGPSLARMAVRATQLAGKRRRIIGVARFTDPCAAESLQRHGVETIPCDLLNPDALARLPDLPNVVAMTAMKFGSSGNQARTWAANTFMSGLIARRFRDSRIVAFSTGNVYPLTPIAGGGSRETDPPGPIGEYAMSCLGRERLYEDASRTYGTRTALVRLNYACELRYGVLVDLARKVWAGDPIDVSMPAFNVIWQADANAMALRLLEHVASPPLGMNVAGLETLSVRTVAAEFGRRLGREVRFIGEEAATALLSNASEMVRLFGPPSTSVEQLIEWIADWIRRGGVLWDKPTKFQVRDGKF